MSVESIYLPMGEPEIYGHTLYGFLFSVAREKDMPWIYSHFIQVLYKRDWGMMVYQDHLNLLEGCPFLSGTNIRIDGDEKNSIEYFMKVAKGALKNGYYISLFLDWKIVNPYYGGKPFAHSAIISGYNSEDEKFVIHDNFKDGKFIRIEANCAMVAKAFYSSRFSSVGNENDNNGFGEFDYLKYLTLIHYEKHVFTDFDLDSISSQVKSYLNSSGYMFGCGPEEDIWGRYSYDNLASQIEAKKEKVVRDLHFLYEHKFLMLQRLKAVYSKYDLKSETVIEEFDAICREAKILRNLYIKKAILQKESNKELDVLKEKLMGIKKQEENSLIKFENAIISR